MKSRLILTLKLFVVAALFVVIFYSIEWHDSFKRVDAQGEVSATVEGEIVGPWDGDTGAMGRALRRKRTASSKASTPSTVTTGP